VRPGTRLEAGQHCAARAGDVDADDPVRPAVPLTGLWLSGTVVE
jgi:hypothetical protein